MANGIERFLSCRFGIAQHDGATPSEGWNSDYSCSNSEITERIEDRLPNTTDKYVDGDDNVVFRSIEMYPFGNTAQLNVKANLNLWCGNCPFYKSKES